MVEEISSCESWKDLLEILEDEAGPDGTGLTLFVGVKVGIGWTGSWKDILEGVAGPDGTGLTLFVGVNKVGV